MAEVDGRRLGDAVLEALRRRAVALACGGMAQRQIAAVLGVHWNTVGRWLQAWRRGGEAALARKKRGRRPDEQLRLAPAQAAAIRRLIRDRCPDQLKLAFALWTREAVQALIARRYGIELSLASVGRYLRRWGFTPQKPLRRAIERDPEAVRRWLEETYPEIRARARSEGAEIHWGDESGIANQAAPCGAVGTPHPTSGPQLRAQGPDAGDRHAWPARHHQHDLERHQPRPAALHAFLVGCGVPTAPLVTTRSTPRSSCASCGA